MRIAVGGGRTWVRAAVVAAGMWTAAQAQAPGDVRVALVIGNGAYAGAAALPNPPNDARSMGDTLRALGFEVQEVRDAGRAQMQQAIEKVGGALKGKQGIAMFYYAGHGLQQDWRNYMVPVDAKLAQAPDVPAQTVDVATVLEAFRAAGTRMNIVVLDACRDTPFKEAATARGLAQLDAPPGTLLAYATAPGNVAEDGNGSNGLYTAHLLQELVKPQARIEDVFKRTRFAVRRASSGRQIPWESTSLEEDFMFNAGRVVATPRPNRAEGERAYAEEKALWTQAQASGKVEDVYAFLARYPSGSFSEMAILQLAALQKPAIVPQPGPEGAVTTPFLERNRAGDRYAIVWKDGLTGNELSRSSYELRPVGSGEFQSHTLQGPPFDVRIGQAGYVVADRLGTYAPPMVSIPGAEFKLGNKASGRTVVTLRDGGAKLWAEWEVRTTARETIDTAFGKLNTWRVETTSITQNGHRVFSTSWYDTEWGFPVRTRSEVRTPTGARDIRVRDVLQRSRGT